MTYGVLMVDPPWPKRKGGLRRVRPRQGRLLDYPTMPVPDIFTLLDTQIFSIASPTHTVFLWVVEEFLTEAEAAMQQRGYRRHVRMVWDKGNGPAPAFTVRYCHEYLHWYYKPKFLPIAPEQRGVFRSVFQAPPREHSRKPDAAYRMIDAFYPEQARLDVFSREARKGWDQWGNQTDYFQEVG